MKKILFLAIFCTHFSAQAQRTGTDYAVFFYVTDFQPGWASLPETAKEAADLKSELETNFGFQCEAVANPSKAQILAKIKAYNDRLSEKDQVLFFFSMHGHYEESAERGFLIAADGALQDEYGETWLSYDDLSGFLARCKAKHVLLALDACHSGAFGIRNKARPDVPGYSQAEDCTQRVAKTFQFAGRQFCTSGNKSSKTPAKSLFASRFLEALRKGGQDGIIRFDDLEYYLGKVENPRPENGTFRGHTPGGDFVFVKKGGCTATAPVANTAPQNDSNNKDVLAWNKANTENTKAAYQAYKQSNCPGGSFCEAADARIGVIMGKDKSKWEAASRARTIDALETYLKEAPDGAYREDAKAAIEQIKTAIVQTNIDQARKKEELDWKTASETGTLESYQKYLTDYPNGTHQKEAQADAARMEKLKKAVTSTDGMVLVPGGTFKMGCTSEQQDCMQDEYPVHMVTVSDFYLCKFEVTQKQWRQVMEDNLSWYRYPKCEDCPMLVNRTQAIAFMLKLNKTLSPGQNPYRFPTEAEWEYAARECGKAVLFGNGKNIADPKEINFSCEYDVRPYSLKGKTRSKLMPVGSSPPNALGLYHMSGNVSEFTNDVYADYGSKAVVDPTGPPVKYDSIYAVRGGSINDGARDCRVSARKYILTTSEVGIRLARSK